VTSWALLVELSVEMHFFVDRCISPETGLESLLYSSLLASVIPHLSGQSALQTLDVPVFHVALFISDCFPCQEFGLAFGTKSRILVAGFHVNLPVYDANGI
jgi:hypothetical protein